MERLSLQPFARISPDRIPTEIVRTVPVETPVAIEVNGIGYAVLMASPGDLVDLVYGFLLTDRLVEDAADIVDVDLHYADGGVIARAAVSPAAGERLTLRIRHRTSDSSCGLCGIETLEQALRPLPRLTRLWAGADMAVFAALQRLPDHQALNHLSGAVHAAARCSAEGHILEVREDVGRHNALDKLIGAAMRARAAWDGFVLMTSRCSYELVEKTVIAGCPMLATISAPTDLAVRRASEAGLALRVLARPDAMLASIS